jgi:hypothetical protein
MLCRSCSAVHLDSPMVDHVPSSTLISAAILHITIVVSLLFSAPLASTLPLFCSHHLQMQNSAASGELSPALVSIHPTDQPSQSDAGSISPTLVGERTNRNTGGCAECQVLVRPHHSDGVVFLYKACPAHADVDVVSLLVKSRRKSPSGLLTKVLWGFAPHVWSRGSEFVVGTELRTVEGICVCLST